MKHVMQSFIPILQKGIRKLSTLCDALGMSKAKLCIEKKHLTCHLKKYTGGPRKEIEIFHAEDRHHLKHPSVKGLFTNLLRTNTKKSKFL